MYEWAKAMMFMCFFKCQKRAFCYCVVVGAVDSGSQKVYISVFRVDDKIAVPSKDARLSNKM